MEQTNRGAHNPLTVLSGFCRAGAAVFLLASCAMLPVAEADYDLAADAVVEHPLAEFNPNDAQLVFARGFGAIAERYIDDIPVSRLALEGMRGLSSIDPAFVVQDGEDDLFLVQDTRRIARFLQPDESDAREWARLTVAVTLRARRVSPAIGATEPERLYQAVFDSTMAALDRFSRYAGAEEARTMRESRSGFGGVGLRYRLEDDGVRVTEVMPETPAEKAGLEAGDMILAIGDARTAEMDSREVSRLLRGSIGTTVRLSLRSARDGSERDLELRRALIIPPTVALTLENKVARIKVSGFNSRTTSHLAAAVRKALADEDGPPLGILLDMRGNPGGLLDQAISVSDLFLPQGPIVSTRGRHNEANQRYQASSGDVAEGLPMVVVLDGRSASAAEIVAAALQDRGRAVVIGSNSYGKGTVQTVVPLPNRGEMTLTWSRFHTPTGYALHGLGVLPTVCINEEADSTLPGLLEALREGETNSPILAQWRASEDVDDALRRELRRACPAHADDRSRLAEEVGQHLLADRNLYMRALTVSTPPESEH